MRCGLLLALFAASARAFVVAHKPLARPSTAKTLARRGGAVVERAGAGARAGVAMSLAGVLSSRWGVPALTGVATTVLVPLTMVRQGYVFSVGYGSAVAAIGATLLAAHRPAPLTAPWWLAAGLVTYGARLAAHLLVRELTVPAMAARIKAFDKSTRLQRVPFALSVALFYAMMCSPAMYALRATPAAAACAAPGAWRGLAQRAALGGAWLGLVVEAAADAHKLVVKRRLAVRGDGTFAGPTTALYARCRHPNYLGEVLFWAGTFAAGAPAFGANAGAWLVGALGLWGIVSIMLAATARLDGNQREKYGGQPAYDAWVAQSGALLPRLV